MLILHKVCTMNTSSALLQQLPLSNWNTLKANTKLLGENVMYMGAPIGQK